jgi:hypothetical protein
MDFSQAFGTIRSAEKLAKSVDTVLKNSKGHKRAILRELQENINLLFLVQNNQLPPGKVIEKLERKNYLAAADAGFNFKLIKRSALKEETVKDVPQFKKYIGWSTERMLENIYLKVKQLQDIVVIDPEQKTLNLQIRLENLLRFMLLLIQHMK